MAPHVQPSTLYCLSKAQVAANLANTCRILQILAQDTCVAYVLTLTRTYLRPIWQSFVPSTIRAILLEETAALLNTQNSDGTVYAIGAAPLYLLALLLAPDIRKLRIELCCYYGCTHQTGLLKFLASEGRGLETLELARSTLLRLDRSQLQSVLVSATSLRHLTFRNIASDSILQIIGSHCPNLISLDVSHSREVTDVGLQQLFLQVEFRDKVLYNKQNGANPEKRLLARCKNTIRNFTKTLRKACQVPKKTDNKNVILVLEYFEKRNSLCSTLKYLNIANTAVSSAGIMFAIRQVPGLESLGEYCHIGRTLELLEIMDSEENINKPYKLKFINTSRTTVHRLELISHYFPTLHKLKVTEPMHPPNSLSLIPKSVVSLHLQSIPANELWVRGIYDYLNGPQGKLLKELSLRFFPGDASPVVDLSEFLPNCTNLYSLIIDGAQLEWNSSSSSSNLFLTYLHKVQLGRTMTVECLHNLLKVSPVLQIVHLYSCQQLRATDLYNFSRTSKNFSETVFYEHQRKRKEQPTPDADATDQNSLLSTIECFYIYEIGCLSTEALKIVIDKFPRLQRIGNIRSCGLHYTDVQALDKWIGENNVDVELGAGSHWFSSACFPL